MADYVSRTGVNAKDWSMCLNTTLDGMGERSAIRKCNRDNSCNSYRNF